MRTHRDKIRILEWQHGSTVLTVLLLHAAPECVCTVHSAAQIFI